MTVYSKDRGITRREPPHPTGDRVPSYRHSPPERLQVPFNYRGHAIVDGEEHPLGSLFSPETDSPPLPDLPAADQPTPRFDGLPRVSDLGDSRRHAPRTLPASFAVAEEPVSPSSDPFGIPAEAVQPSPAAPVTPKPERPTQGHSFFASARSLLGNGLGLEELLLLGLILFLLREGEGEERGDLDETVILLGLLLLLG